MSFCARIYYKYMIRLDTAALSHNIVIIILLVTSHYKLFLYLYIAVVLLFRHKADKFYSRDIHTKFFLGTLTYALYTLPLDSPHFFFLAFRRSFRTKQNDIFLALEEKIHFSTLSLFIINSFCFYSIITLASYHFFLPISFDIIILKNFFILIYFSFNNLAI